MYHLKDSHLEVCTHFSLIYFVAKFVSPGVFFRFHTVQEVLHHIQRQQQVIHHAQEEGEEEVHHVQEQHLEELDNVE